MNEKITGQIIDTIETTRLYLRSFEKEDARFAISIWNDPEMGEYLPDEAMTEIDENYVREIEQLSEAEDCCYFISELKDTHQKIGTCSFMVSDDGKIYDIAYCVHRDHWRNGYATEAAKGMIDYAVKQGADTITVRVNKENIASNQVVRKLGFTLTGEKSYKKRGTQKMFTDYLYELHPRKN
ncbi:MAG: GNAT family N-acetyltransferase [Lachnospiraceae bacterium]|nr:GNAT family N-acetyltransferase [Lachnospiraceae bacterium]